MNIAVAPSSSTPGQLALVDGKTRLSLLAAALAGLAAAVYVALYAALTGMTSPVPAATSALVPLLVPLAVLLPATVAALTFRRVVAPEASVFAGSEREKRAVRWFNRLASAVITGAACGWATWLLILIVTPILHGAAVATPALIAAAGVVGGLLGGFIAFSTSAISQRDVMIRLVLMVGLGLLLAMLLTEDTHWWRDSLSYMGRAGSGAPIFALTMMLEGLGLRAVFLEMGAGLRRLAEGGRFPPRAAMLLRVSLVVASLGVMAVGAFRDNDNPINLHKLLGNAGFVIFLIAMFALRWLAPPFGRTAHVASAIIGGLSIVVVLLSAVTILNFVTFELLVIALLVAWLFLFEAYCSSLI